MKSKLLTFFFVAVFLCMGSSSLYAINFWTSEMGTPTPSAPDVNNTVMPASYQTATPTAIVVPSIQAVAPTPTPRPGLQAIDSTAAALFSVVIPGSGQVYAGDPLKGVVLASLFGVGLWQTLDNLTVRPDGTGRLVSKDENLGSFCGLATLIVYGFQIQDASDTANHYNKANYLTFNLGISPEPKVQLAYRF